MVSCFPRVLSGNEPPSMSQQVRRQEHASGLRFRGLIELKPLRRSRSDVANSGMTGLSENLSAAVHQMKGAEIRHRNSPREGKSAGLTRIRVSCVGHLFYALQQAGVGIQGQMTATGEAAPSEVATLGRRLAYQKAGAELYQWRNSVTGAFHFKMWP